MRQAIVLVLLSLLFAGCTQTPDLLAEDTYTLEATGVPATTSGTFTFQLVISGDLELVSDHVGAHYWNQTTANPMADFGASAGCAHTGGEMPGNYDITCTMPPGTWYLRAHARVSNDADEVFNFFGDEFVVVAS